MNNYQVPRNFWSYDRHAYTSHKQDIFDFSVGRFWSCVARAETKPHYIFWQSLAGSIFAITEPLLF